MMKRIALFSILLVAGNISLRAQTVPSATTGRFSVVAGGTASVFQPDFIDNSSGWTYICLQFCGTSSAVYEFYPAAQNSKYPLFGAGAFVDLKFTRWIQLEAEARWLRFNQYEGAHQDHYLVGPRVPLRQFGKATVYAKALVGFGKMTFDSLGDRGTFTAFAGGGGIDYKLTKKISIRAIDVEYQEWPKWGNSSVSPYGASVGISYKIY